MYLLLPFCIFVACLRTDASADNSHSIMSYAAYAVVRHNMPYMFKIENDKKTLYYFGANHSCDPNDPQYPALEIFWQDFLEATQGQQRIVLVEGNIRGLAATKEDAIMTAGGEGGYITFLAHQHNIPVVCPEPRKSKLIQGLLKEFSIEEVAYMEFAQAAVQASRYREIRGPMFDAETFITGSLVDFTRFFTGCFYEHTFTLEGMKQIHRTLFSQDLNLLDRTFFSKITDPVAGHCVINAVCRMRSILRDEVIVKYIQRKLTANMCLFVVYGATHAVMQENALTNCTSNQ